MEEQLKRRLVGAVVLVSLAVIFLPMLINDPRGEGIEITTTNIPPQPVPRQEATAAVDVFESKVFLPDDEPLIPPLKQEERATPLGPKPAPKPRQTTASDTPRPEIRTGLSAWVIQVASLSKQDRAEDLVRKLKAQGHSAFMEQVYIKGRNLYRIRVGPELDRKRAERTAEAINTAFKVKGQVLRYP